MFENLKTDNSIEQEKDVLGGGRVMESGLVDFTIKAAFFTKSAGGALALNLHLDSEQGELRSQQWVTSGDAKGNKNYYETKDGKKHYLPGFNIANAICLLTVGKELGELATDGVEEKVINLWDSEARAEVPTKVNMLMPLLKQGITAGVLKEIVDKRENVAAEGEKPDYQPTGETREQNEIDKIFRLRDGLTVAEIRAGDTEPKFKEQWADKFTGTVRDKSTKVTKGGATAGAPAGTTKTPSLFG